MGLEKYKVKKSSGVILITNPELSEKIKYYKLYNQEIKSIFTKVNCTEERVKELVENWNSKEIVKPLSYVEIDKEEYNNIDIKKTCLNLINKILDENPNKNN